MSFGPIELVVLRFEEPRFEGEVLREIQQVVDNGTIAVIDILVAVRLGDEPVRVLEITELEDPILERWEPVVTDAGGLLTHRCRRWRHDGCRPAPPAEEVGSLDGIGAMALPSLDGPTQSALVEGYEPAQLQALKTGLLVSAGVALTALMFTRDLPSQRPLPAPASTVARPRDEDEVDLDEEPDAA